MTRLKLAALAALVLAFLAMGYALHRAHARATALENRLDAAKLDDIAKDRAQAQQDGAALARSRAEVEGQVKALKVQASALEARVRALDADLARQQAAGKKLVETGSVDDVVRFGQQLGLHPVKR